MFSRQHLEKYKYEVFGVFLALWYIIFYLRGVGANKKLADKWISVLGQPDGVLARNFSVYAGEGALNATWKESATTYKTYASGRRYCSGALFTFNLKARQDLFCLLWYFVSPREDVLEVDVLMDDALMPPTVLVLGQHKQVKAILKEQPDISNYTKNVQVSRDRAWSPDVAKGWTVLAEQSSLFYDLLNTEPAIAKALALKWFRSAIISSEDTSGNSRDESGSNGSSSSGEGDSSSSSSSEASKSRFRFVFALPPPGKADELNQLLSAVFLLVDLVGSYKVSPEMKKRAIELRTKLQQEAAKKRSAGRQEQLAMKRSERLEAERAKARAAGPQALAKFEEKMQRQMRNKEMRKRTKFA